MLAKAIDESGHLSQSVDVKEVRGVAERKSGRGIRREVGGVQSDSGMSAVWQADDDVGVLALTDADDRQLLSVERMMGMGDGHESRRGLGRRGSAL